MIADHSFEHSLRASRAASILPIWEETYRKAFPDFATMCDHSMNGYWQKQGIDRSVILHSSKQILIDEKVRFRNHLTGKVYTDILLEVWSDKERKIPGWIQKPLMCDFIAYAIAPLGVCYLLPVVQLQQAWVRNGERWIKDYGTKSASNSSRSGSWITESVCIPPSVIGAAMVSVMEIAFTPMC